MQFVSLSTGLALALSLTAPVLAQAAGDDTTNQNTSSATRTAIDDNRLHLKYGVFDPLAGLPMIPEQLLAGADTNLYIVQFNYAFIDADRDALRAAGAKLHSPLPHNALVVRMDAGQAAVVNGIEGVRWVGPFQPAYRLEGDLLNEIAAHTGMPAREYNMVMADKHNDKATLEAKIKAIGGAVTHRHPNSLLFSAKLTEAQLIQAARLDEVLWIDRTPENELDMNNARNLGGSNYIETQGGYTGTGIRGHVYEGVENNHPDFNFVMTNVLSGGQAQSHGHCTAGIVFGNGTSAASARGHAPNARGYYTNYTTVNGGVSRNDVIDAVVNTHNCMFTTASWGGSRTTQYTSTSADSDDIVFDHRIPWTQSQSNAGNQNSRPQAWAKNVISVGGMRHFNDANPANDSWGNGASIGPAADGRIKPDLCNFYDSVWTSDRTGSNGYSSGNSTTGFNGTSAATPIVAGTNALACQMYTDFLFCNTPRVSGGTRFQNRPYAQTLKALQIVNASLYPWGTGTGQAIRNYQGWGYPNLRTMYDNRDKMMVVAEDNPIQQGQTHSYWVNVEPGTPVLKICMSYLDPAGNVAASIDRINDLTMEVLHPNGVFDYWGNAGLKTNNNSSTLGSADTIDTVEMFIWNNPPVGLWRIDITAPVIAQDAHTATAATDATYALVAMGGARDYNGCARYTADDAASAGTDNFIPFGTSAPSTLLTTFANNNGNSSPGHTVYMDVTPTASSSHIYLHGLAVHTDVTAGTEIAADIYRRSGTYVGNTTSSAGWTLWTTAKGESAGTGNESVLDFNSGIYLASGSTNGIAVVARNYDSNYTNGANTYSNADLTVDTGAASSGTFSGSQFSPRTGNFRLRYQRDSATWHNQKYQTILRCDELGGAGDITGLSFASSASSVHYNRIMRIRMTHKPAGYALSTNFNTNISGSTTVLSEVDHSWEVRANAWNEIGLQNSFAYDGVSDVVVELMCRGNHTSTGSVDEFHRDPNANTPRAFACGWPWSSEPSTTTGGTAVEGIDNFGTMVRAEFACANVGDFGTSCGTADGYAASTPVAGTSYAYRLQNAPANAGAFIIMGFGVPGTPLSTSGFDGCYAWIDNVASVFKLTSASGFASHTVNVPNTTIYDGLIINGYWAALDSNAAGGLTFTNYTRAIIGQSNN
ncbi:MAG: S8 family serine peptidase [bacterium]|nr:S8 family serine peptidase [bacterium]